VNGRFSSISFSSDGKLVLADATRTTVWDNKQQHLTVSLKDTGNLVITDPSTGRALWKSFHWPTDTGRRQHGPVTAVGTFAYSQPREHLLGDEHLGDREQAPSVTAAHVGTSTAYPDHCSSAAPQHATIPTDEPMIASRSATSHTPCARLITPRAWYRQTRSATAIMTKMKSVLMERRLASTSRLEKNATQALAAVMSAVACTGVPRTSANTGGMMWLWAMCVAYRAFPSAPTSSTIVTPFSAPTATKRRLREKVILFNLG
jgi:hypothetical protein